MADEPESTPPFSLRRWSQRKHAAARQERLPPAAPARTDGVPVRTEETALRGSDQGRYAPPAAPVGAPPPPAPGQPELPPVESLTFESDFAPFMRKDVDEGVRRSALRRLLRDPRFNVMDGLDVYIDDYSKPSPLEPELVRTLAQARYLFDPPKTRVTPEGHVEDVPDEPAPTQAEAQQRVEAPAPLADAATAAPAPSAPAHAEPASLPDRPALDGAQADAEGRR